MSRPSGWKPYTLADGTTVPSVTTVISRFRDSGGLLHWSWKEGLAGRDYRKTREDAADAGTLAHAMVEAAIHGRTAEIPDAEPEIVAKARQAFASFEHWARRTKLRPAHPETRLVSETHRFGGTLDALFIDDLLSIGDLKTANAIYPDHLIQVAAYGLLWRENFPDEPITGGYHILKVSKDHADFSHHFFADLSDAADAFLLMRRLYDLDARLKARVR